MRRGASTAAAVALVTVTAYLALLGWDQQKTRGADGYLHGPYQPWQVGLLVGVLAAAAVWCGYRGQMWIGTVTATVTLTAAWSIDAATDAYDPDLWPIGALMIASSTFVGFVTISGVSKALFERRRTAARSTQPPANVPAR